VIFYGDFYLGMVIILEFIFSAMIALYSNSIWKLEEIVIEKSKRVT